MEHTVVWLYLRDELEEARIDLIEKKQASAVYWQSTLAYDAYQKALNRVKDLEKQVL